MERAGGGERARTSLFGLPRHGSEYCMQFENIDVSGDSPILSSIACSSCSFVWIWRQRVLTRDAVLKDPRKMWRPVTNDAGQRGRRKTDPKRARTRGDSEKKGRLGKKDQTSR